MVIEKRKDLACLLRFLYKLCLFWFEQLIFDSLSMKKKCEQYDGISFWLIKNRIFGLIHPEDILIHPFGMFIGSGALRHF